MHFLIGEAEESFQQWKKVVNLLVYSEKIYMGLRMKGTVDLVNEFIVVFYEQLQQFPKDFFVDELSKDSFIADSLKRLYSYISESSTISKTRKRLLALFEMVSTRFNYIPNDDLSEE